MQLPPLSAHHERVLDGLRSICLRLPDTSEAIKWGCPHFLVGEKIFVGFGPYGGRFTIGTKQTLVDQALLVEDPRFFRSPYVGKHGWVSLVVDGAEPDWALVEDLVGRSYRLIAPQRLVARLDAPAPEAGKRRKKA